MLDAEGVPGVPDPGPDGHSTQEPRPHLPAEGEPLRLPRGRPRRRRRRDRRRRDRSRAAHVLRRRRANGELQVQTEKKVCN